MNKFDLVIIGAGPGGYRAAEYAARQGLQVLIVERDEVGGTCLNRGCIPTKTYVHSATFAEACERQQQVVMQLRSGVEQLMRAPGITLTKGSCFTCRRIAKKSHRKQCAREIFYCTNMVAVSAMPRCIAAMIQFAMPWSSMA